MKLNAYILNGNVLGLDLLSWVEQDLNNNKPFIVSRETPEGYQDITGVETWHNCSLLTWFLRRSNILPLFYSVAGNSLQNFGGLNNQIKLIACELFLIPYSLRMQIINNEQDKINWEKLLIKSKEHRLECIEKMRVYTGDYMRTGLLSLTQSQNFFNDVSEYIYRYEQTNGNEFKLFIDGTDGVFITKDYYREDLQQGLLNIYTGESWD
jgi:hypothetical protein